MEKRTPILIFEKRKDAYLGRVLFYTGEKSHYKDIRPTLSSKIQTIGTTILEVENKLLYKIEDFEKKENLKI